MKILLILFLNPIPYILTPTFMTLDTLIMLIGAFIILEPQLGFPASWDTLILSVAGVCVIALGIAVRRRGLRELVRKQEPESTRVQ